MIWNKIRSSPALPIGKTLLISSLLKDFVRRDHVADEEFSVLVPDICSVLRRMNYDSYCVTYARMGYEVETRRPCIIVIATQFSNTDAIDVQNVRSSSLAHLLSKKRARTCSRCVHVTKTSKAATTGIFDRKFGVSGLIVLRQLLLPRCDQ